MLDNDVVGHILSFEMFGELEVTYWIDRMYFGKGIATEALKQFLPLVTIRPLYARAAKDNIGSIRVLEKCGFAITDEDKGFANARNQEMKNLSLFFGANNVIYSVNKPLNSTFVLIVRTRAIV